MGVHSPVADLCALDSVFQAPGGELVYCEKHLDPPPCE